jgi:hypothetical protein
MIKSKHDKVFTVQSTLQRKIYNLSQIMRVLTEDSASIYIPPIAGRRKLKEEQI